MQSAQVGMHCVGLPDFAWGAAENGDAQAVAAWLDDGGGVDDASALLMAAAFGGQEAIVRMLLRRGTGVNLQDSLGWTALMHAARHGHTTIAQMLLNAKADALLQDITGYTALAVAENNQHTATAQLVRQHVYAKRPMAETEAAVMHAAATAPTPNLSGCRVRILDLKGRPELNGRCGVAGRFNAAKGRYAVTVEGEVEAVLLKPANLRVSRANPSPNS